MLTKQASGTIVTLRFTIAPSCGVMCTPMCEFLALSLFLLLVGCTSSVENLLTEADSAEVSINESGVLTKNYALQRSDSRFKSLVELLNRHKEGWESTPATYVPGVYVSTPNGSINFLANSVIVNLPKGQYAKSINPSEYRFLIE